MTHMFPNEGASSSSTSMSSQRSETDDDKMIAMVLEEEYARLDGAMAKCLSNLTSIPHVPRNNTYFPTYSDATMDHYRLLDRLNAYGLFEVRVSGDGNCQFRALSDQLYRLPEYHKHVRKEIVKQLKACNSLYEGHVPMKYKHYCKKMKKSGEWRDHVTLQAAADKFAAKKCLLTSFRDTCFVEIVPQYQAPQRALASFWSEIHNNSLYDARDLPSKYKPKEALVVLVFMRRFRLGFYCLAFPQQIAGTVLEITSAFSPISLNHSCVGCAPQCGIIQHYI